MEKRIFSRQNMWSIPIHSPPLALRNEAHSILFFISPSILFDLFRPHSPTPSSSSSACIIHLSKNSQRRGKEEIESRKEKEKKREKFSRNITTLTE